MRAAFWALFVLALLVVSHAWLSSDWMAQAGFSLRGLR